MLLEGLRFLSLDRDLLLLFSFFGFGDEDLDLFLDVFTFLVFSGDLDRDFFLLILPAEEEDLCLSSLAISSFFLSIFGAEVFSFFIELLLLLTSEAELLELISLSLLFLPL